MLAFLFLNLTPALSESDIVYVVSMAVLCSWTTVIYFNFIICWFFSIKQFFPKYVKNEIKDNNEKSCSWSRKTVSQKIDLKAVWPRNGHADSVGVSIIFFIWNITLPKTVVSLESFFHADLEVSDAG